MQWCGFDTQGFGFDQSSRPRNRRKDGLNPPVIVWRTGDWTELFDAHSLLLFKLTRFDICSARLVHVHDEARQDKAIRIQSIRCRTCHGGRREEKGRKTVRPNRTRTRRPLTIQERRETEEDGKGRAPVQIRTVHPIPSHPISSLVVLYETNGVAIF
ncbi:uncharacterized protein HMPREF1120_07764 [Exophiala dermatitidis NIH/UT8656]|uniref:Uncharacterized protein n=1 Tax=Exophiala dermatitidis (strain ATCC 34100 / CBS 525.76 / NIH/UT8656) TaxID=858893 RepID=H6C570_EXODN|nr:uncharacterized protein HMPREF1120_07764 [Exophiala dermatitidis NIH/UT8656]EHY59782.1 hypothetical protein HMPREF1120_07764 [Exophiala dermatitidis NIH/UT8656]